MESKEIKNISAELDDEALESLSAGSTETVFGVKLKDLTPEMLQELIGNKTTGGICLRCGGNTVEKRIEQQGQWRDAIVCESCSAILRYLDVVTSLPLPMDGP